MAHRLKKRALAHLYTPSLGILVVEYYFCLNQSQVWSRDVVVSAREISRSEVKKNNVLLTHDGQASSVSKKFIRNFAAIQKHWN